MGDLEEKAKLILASTSICTSGKYFEFAILCFNDFISKVNVFSHAPTKIDDDVNFYIMVFGTIKVYFKCDVRPFPVDLRSSILSEERNHLMMESEFTDHIESEKILELLKKLNIAPQ